MRTSIITGANCFIGRHLCKALADRDSKVYAVMRPGSAHSSEIASLPGVIPIWCEGMEEYSQLSSAIHENCDTGIMLAWNGTRGSDRDDPVLQNCNMFYSQKCACSMIELGCKTIVLAGSQAEYGPMCTARKTSEEDKPNPNTEYGKNKLMLYNWLCEYAQKRDVRIIEPRFFSLYGEDDYEKTMLISLIQNLLLGKKCELTQCEQVWDYMYIEDAINALCIILDNPRAQGIYNFGSGNSKPLKEYVECIRELVDREGTIIYGAVDYPKTGMVHTNPDVSRLQNEIGYCCKYDFITGISIVIKKQKELLGV